MLFELPLFDRPIASTSVRVFSIRKFMFCTLHRYQNMTTFADYLTASDLTLKILQFRYFIHLKLQVASAFHSESE